MKEIVFLNSNAARWTEFEKLLDSPVIAMPDKLAELFVQLTDDLAFSRTYYPTSNTTKYLNSLAAKAHLLIYKNKKEKSNRIEQFWRYEFPLTFYRFRKFMLYSLIIFMAATLIGVLSAANDTSFVRLILGDYYVNMTLHNIERGDPLAVYKDANRADMFLGITVNNIRVSFLAFVMGIFASFGTGLILFYNGVMLGSFHYFFYEHGLLSEALLTIWIHGTLEIFAIIAAGGAGMMLGNGMLFPGTYSRTASFVNHAKNGVKIIFGLIPVFIVAGFFEGFITRYYQAHWIIRLPFILGSFWFIVWYFYIYPRKLIRQNKKITTNKSLLISYGINSN